MWILLGMLSRGTFEYTSMDVLSRDRLAHECMDILKYTQQVLADYDDTIE